MNVLSLFDGMSCGQIALNRLGIKYENYYASEIDKYAIQITMKNFPNTIQLGTVVNVVAKQLPKIDLMIGGSPCQSFSFAGKRKGMSTKDNEEIHTLERYLELKADGFMFEGESYLFWEYVRLLKEVKPKYFLLENVRMEEKWENIISKTLGLKPLRINSAKVSAQNRRRLYWTNIGQKAQGLFDFMESTIPQPKDKHILLKHILDSNVDEKYFLSDKIIATLFGSTGGKNDNFKKAECRDVEDKANAVLARCYKMGRADNYIDDYSSVKVNNSQSGEVHDINHKSVPLCANGGGQGAKTGLYKIGKRIRRLTPTECERLQTVEVGYTQGISDTQRYSMLGNGWTVDVVAHILSYINK